MEKIVGGIRMEIPDDATRETLLEQSHRPADSTVYAITPDGGHRVLNPGESAASARGERLGIIGRFRTGRKVSIECDLRLEIPDDVTKETLLQALTIPIGSTVSCHDHTDSLEGCEECCRYSDRRQGYGEDS